MTKKAKFRIAGRIVSLVAARSMVGVRLDTPYQGFQFAWLCPATKGLNKLERDTHLPVKLFKRVAIRRVAIKDGQLSVLEVGRDIRGARQDQVRSDSS